MEKIQKMMNAPIAAMKPKEHVTEADLKPGEILCHSELCYAPFTNLRAGAFCLPAPKNDEVQVKVECVSLCHTDISMIRNELGITSYPFAPGHEIIATVTKLGSDVSAFSQNLNSNSNLNAPPIGLGNPSPNWQLRIGQRVGIGFFKRSCHACEYCLKGLENICPKGEPVMAFNGNRGGFSEFINVDFRMCIPIPDELPSEYAAPLLCAGITVWNPLTSYVVPRPSGTQALSNLSTVTTEAKKRVGVVGFGGLGHLFVKFANALGCETFVFTHTESKKEDIHGLGANFVTYSRESEVEPLKESLDFILTTAYADLDWQLFMKCLKPDGVLCFVGFPKTAIKVPVFDLIYKQRKVVGSNVGSPAQISEMLQFCVEKGIRPEIEQKSLRDLNNIISRFEPDGMRYRAVFRMDINEMEPKSG